MLYGRALWLSGILLVAANVVTAADTDSSEKLRQIAFRHVMFEQFQDEPRAAYIAAEGYERRGISSESIKLAQAGASLDLGYLEHGRALIANLEQGSLSPQNQSRLYLYLAQDAYRRRDWGVLGSQLSSLSSLSSLEAAPKAINDSGRERNLQAYLQLELSLHQQNMAHALEYLAQIDRDSGLRPYALFNVAVAETQNQPSAISYLTEIVERSPQDFAEFMLADRARVALAEIYLEQDEWKTARASLAKVSASHTYGPHALAQLARLDMQAERYEDAAAIWQYLLTKHPWHRASSHAVSGLGYALQHARGDEFAYRVYSEGLQSMTEQQHRLVEVATSLRSELQHPEELSSTDDALLVRMSDALGRDDWLDWLASHNVRQMADRWQALNQAYHQLVSDRERLSVLQGVDAEQQRRIAEANRLIGEGQLAQRLVTTTALITQARHRLLIHEYTIDDDLSAFANAEQQWSLTELEYLRRRFSQLPMENPAADTREHTKARLARLARLEGLVRFSIFEKLPHERQKQIDQFDRQLAVASRASQRLKRMVGAASQQTDGVGARIVFLADRRQALEEETGLALSSARQELIASLDEVIQDDLDRLRVQIAGLEYDVTRLADHRLAAGEAP